MSFGKQEKKNKGSDSQTLPYLLTAMINNEKGNFVQLTNCLEWITDSITRGK
jgi:hypothetical protein